MQKLITLIVMGLILTVGCKPKDAMVNKNEAAGEFYGETFKVTKVMSFNDLMSKIEKEGSVEDVVVSGHVEGVCKVKGCWMNLSDGKNADKNLFVKFKDYGFFMPLDLTGDVIMKGKAYKEETSVEELRHYAEDDGKSAEEIAAITKPRVEYKFLATGVQVK